MRRGKTECRENRFHGSRSSNREAKKKNNKSCFYSRSSTDDDELVSCSEVTRSVSSGVRECVLVQEVLRIQCERIIKYFEMLSRWPAAFVIFVVTWSSTHQAQARIISAFLYNDMLLSLDTKLRREIICIRLPNSSQKSYESSHCPKRKFPLDISQPKRVGRVSFKTNA